MIKYIDYLIPKGRITIDDVFDSLEEDKLPPTFETKEDGVSFFKDVLQLTQVANAETLSEADMLNTILTRFFDLREVLPSEVDLIIMIGDELNKGSRIANLGHYVQHQFDLKNADVLVLAGNHCSNVEYAISYGEALLFSGDFNNILIVAVNKLIRCQERVIGSYAVQGDGAGLVYLTSDTKVGVKVSGKYAITNGILYEADVNGADPFLICKNYMLCLSGFMKKYDLTPDEITYVIIQNANHILISQCLNSIGFKTEQIFTDNLTAYGHLDCIDFIVNLKTISDFKTNQPTKIISFGTGWAGSNICLLMEIV